MSYENEPSREILELNMQPFVTNWKEARAEAVQAGHTIIEHGWEQYVIIDEDNQLIYRYPRHSSAAAKLEDEVTILANLRGAASWPVAIPKLLEYDGTRATYTLIPGDVLDEAKISQLSDAQIVSIGHDLGRFLAYLHRCDPSVVVRSAWQQPGSLIDYYKNRILLADENNPWKAIASEHLTILNHLRKHDDAVPVHGDLHGLNMVIGPSGDHLMGVIDFSEVEIGDPHQDFRKLFMTDARLLMPAREACYEVGGPVINPELVKQWAYVNELSNLCHFHDQPDNLTYQRAYKHLRMWGQFS